MSDTRCDHYGPEFAGTQITGVFGGAGYDPLTLTESFSSIGAFDAEAQLRGDASAVPEPATTALLGAGLAFLGLRARKLRRS